METNEFSHFGDKIISAMHRAATELEEFQLQMALGRAEAQDKYEEMKKRFDSFMHEAKIKVDAGKDKFDDLHQKFDELRVQFALGKAETKEAFQEQKKKVLLAIHNIEHKIKTNPELKKAYAVMLVELEKFKVLVEWVEKKFEKEEEVEEDKSFFERGKAKFEEAVENIKAKFSQEEEKEESRWEHFQNEIGEAFDHFKRAFVKP